MRKEGEVDGNLYVSIHFSVRISMRLFDATSVRFRALPVDGSLSVSIDRIAHRIYLFRTHPTMFFFHYPLRARHYYSAPLASLLFHANVTRFRIINEFLFAISHADQSMLNFKPRSATRRRNRLIIVQHGIKFPKNQSCADSSLASRQDYFINETDWCDETIAATWPALVNIDRSFRRIRKTFRTRNGNSLPRTSEKSSHECRSENSRIVREKFPRDTFSELAATRLAGARGRA
jgi:hypothetical protein